MNKEWCFSGAGGPWGPFAFGPFAFARRSRFFEAGEVRLAILSLLGEGPKHGYQLMKEMEERSGGLYRASAGSVYPTLQQLEDEGLIESDQVSGKRVYRLTDAGRKELERDPETVRRIWERAGRWEDWRQYIGPESMAIFGPLAEVAKAGFRAASKPGGIERVRAVLERTRRDLEAL
jgi:DNA-binding PadR family transcriptional regulator